MIKLIPPALIIFLLFGMMNNPELQKCMLVTIALVGLMGVVAILIGWKQIEKDEIKRLEYERKIQERQCNRNGCENINCERKTSLYGYICRECNDEFKRAGANTDNEINKVINTPKLMKDNT